ncbi:MAG: chlorophyll synthesis pathway protein BchC [Burkholderiales bacterium]
MQTLAVVIEGTGRLVTREVQLSSPEADDIVVDIDWSGISAGTERLLYTGRMPSFPGLGYPLVPGYESVGRVVQAKPSSGLAIGQSVFVPGARCFLDARGLFGGAAQRVIVPAVRVSPIPETLGENAVLLALAATARHALPASLDGHPDLIVGHGALGRLMARIAIASGAPAPTVWESNTQRRSGAVGYAAISPDDDPRKDYRHIYDASGDGALLDTLITRLAPGGEIVLAGFYAQPLSFAFPPAFMREARLRIAAQWLPRNLADVTALIASGKLSLEGLVTHRASAGEAPSAYRTAFEDASCIKMVLDWRACR